MSKFALLVVLCPLALVAQMIPTPNPGDPIRVLPSPGFLSSGQCLGVSGGVWTGLTCSGGTGLTNLNGLVAGTQSFASANDTNVTLSIASLTATHTFTMGWTGTLAKARIIGTAVYNDQANTYSTGLQNLASANLTLPTGAAFTASSANNIGIDSTANNIHAWASAADHVLAAITGSPANNDCAKFSVVGSTLLITTAGAACGGGSSPLTTKGDLFGFSTVNARIPIGTDGQVLTADSTQALGLKWAASGTGVAVQAAGSTVVTSSTLNFASGGLITNVGGVATYNPDTGLLLTNGNDQKNVCKFVNSTNGTTSYTGSLASGCTALTTGNLVAGSTFMLQTNATCSTSCTLQIDGVPAVAASIKKADGTTDPGGAIISGQPQWVTYDGTVFRLQPGGTGGSGPTLQTNGVNNTTQTALNFITSTTNTDGLTVTPSNPATSQEKMEITGNYSGVLASGVTATTQTANDNSTKVATTAYADRVCDPTIAYCAKDDFDFVFASAASGVPVNTAYNYFAQNTGGATSVSCNTASVPAGMFAGYCELDTIATATTGIAFRAASGQAQFALNATTFDYKIRAKLSGTTTIRAYMGWVDPAQVFAWAANNFIAIRYDTNLADTNFMCVAASGGTTTATSTGVAANTSVHTFRIRSTTPGTILCSVDGGSEVSVSTNVPSTALEFDVALLTDTTAVESLTLDYWKMYVALSR